MADVLVAANWQRGGGKGVRPKPIERPSAREAKRKREFAGRVARLAARQQKM